MSAAESKTTFLVLYSNECSDLGSWIADSIIRIHFAGMPLIVRGGEGVSESDFVAIAAEVQKTALTGPSDGLIIVAAFFDGLSEASKAAFGEFRALSAADKRIGVQALNAKKGAHTLKANEGAVITSLRSKLSAEAQATLENRPPAAAASASAASTTTAAVASSPTPSSSANDAGAVLQKEEAVEELTEETLARRVHDGQGEAFWVVLAEKAAFAGAVEALKKTAAAIKCGCFPISDVKDIAASGVGAAAVPRTAREFIVRRATDRQHMEMRLAMCGNVDSGKSTLTSVLTRGTRDDGRGLARAHVFNHKHEADTGRTSSISCNHLGFDSEGAIVNYPKGGAVAVGATGRINSLSTAAIADRSSKMVTLYDLAGHEKYLKTTVLGMTRSLPDYACIVISANNGIQRMTKEHLGLCLALKLPFYIVVTRMDSTPDNIKQETMSNILKLLKMPTVRKLPYPIRRRDDVIVSAKNLRNDRITPIFEVSNVTGAGIEDLLHFINLLPLRKDWNDVLAKPKEMIIDSTFFVAGVGTIVGGIITQGTFRVNDTVMLGPDGLGAFRPTQIKSIHVKGLDVPEVAAGNDAAICLKKEKRSAIRKGNVLIDVSAGPKSHWQFEGEIVILYHSTTIANNYEPVIHSNTVRQSARILLIDQEVLRTGDRAKVKFHFLYRPEYIKVGQRLIFREGRTKGIGTVTRLLDGVDQTFMQSSRMTQKEMVRDTQHKK